MSNDSINKIHMKTRLKVHKLFDQNLIFKYKYAGIKRLNKLNTKESLICWGVHDRRSL